MSRHHRKRSSVSVINRYCSEIAEIGRGSQKQGNTWKLNERAS